MIRKLYLKNQTVSVLTAIFFSCLGLIIQPLFLLVSSGISLIILSFGLRKAIPLIFSSFAVVIVALLLTPKNPDEVWLYGGFSYLLVYHVPITIASLILKKFSSQSLACLSLGFYSMLVILGLDMYINLSGGSWVNVVNTLFENAKIKMDPLVIENISELFVSSLGVLIFLLNIVSLMIARFWQSLEFKPEEFGKEFRSFQLGREISIVLLGMMVLGMFGVNFAQNSLGIVVLLLGLQGLSIIHFVNHQLSWNKGFLVVFYVVFLLLLPLFFIPIWVVFCFILAIVAVVDSWIDLRSRVTV